MKRNNQKLRIFVMIIVIAVMTIGSISLPIDSYAENESDTENKNSTINIEDYFESQETKEAGNSSDDNSISKKESDISEDTGKKENEAEENASKEKSESADTDTEEGVNPENDAKEKEDGKVLRAPARAAVTVWFDGTLGLGTTNSLVQGATNVRATTDGNGAVTLPTSAGSNSKYKLNGWYDINTKKWYAPGERVTVTSDTVFYADWVLNSYDLQQKGTLASGQADTNSFVRTDVFDYNELFNALHGANLSSNTINANQHSETWRDSGGNSFLFMNWYNQNLDSYKSLGAPSNLTLGRNAYNGNNAHGITKNIISSQNDQLLKDLFDTENGIGKQYLGQGDNLFLYDGSGTTESRGFGEGYYYYDSDYNGADYNQDLQRFYVYNTQQYIQGQNRWGSGWTNGQRKPGFMPFEQGTVSEKSGQTDYWFGMKTSVDFFLPDDVGSNGGNCNKSMTNKDMRFYFSGDDDVWVFVDDKLVLDLGGIHQRCAGDINFSTGEIRYYNVNDNGTETLASIDSTTLKSITSGNHKLQIYYLERGSSWSNCSIYFNLAPRYELKIVKSDADDNSVLLPNTEFTIYRDEACTVPAMLYDNKECSGEAKSVFKTNEEGIIECFGLAASQTYYLKETDEPSGYPSVSDKLITLKLDAQGNASLVNTDGDFAVISQDGKTTIDMSVRNKKPEKTSVGAEKKWFDEEGNPLSENIPESIQVQLYRSETSSQTGGTGGQTGTSIPVSITTQYFGIANGSNNENSSLTTGDLSKNLIVKSGGKLHLDLDIIKKQRYEAGIYSVTVNGHSIEPTRVSGKSDQECFIGNHWGQFPPIHAEYDIEDITSETDIKITLIGYLNYISSTPSVKETLSVNTEVTEPSDPGQEEEPQIPSVKPEDAVAIGLPVTLDKNNEWKYIWNNLPVTNEDGTKTYYYYVEELPVSGYSTSYTGNGTINGTVTIVNVRLREIIVNKVWKNAGGTDMQSGMPETISAVLVQKDKTTNTTKEIPFTLSSNGHWRKQWRSDDSELGEIKGHEYEYTVREINAPEGFEQPLYENNNGIAEGSITITNKKTLYTLPDAGGIGTYPFYLIGGFLIALALLLMLKVKNPFKKSQMKKKMLMMAVLALCIGAQNVYAQANNVSVPEIDNANALSLTIDYRYNGNTPITGSVFELCKVADLNLQDGSIKYIYTNEFASRGSFPKQLTASESNDLAKELYKKVKSDGIKTIKKTVVNNGTAIFQNLTAGMYLAAQISEYKTTNHSYSSEPFLVSVPQALGSKAGSEANWQYNVVAQPKSVDKKDYARPTQTDKSSPNKKTDNAVAAKNASGVKTGDLIRYLPAGILMILSALILMLIIFTKGRRGGRT